MTVPPSAEARVEERELIEIENRVTQYPAQAQQDILRLTRELRRLTAAPTPAAPAPTAVSPLYDALTGLLNGGAYGVRFAMARARATRFKKIFAVMSVDLVAQSGGATPEERELTVKHVAQRLEASVRATDTLARIGDENFAVILEDLHHSGDAERVKQIVQDALAAPLVVGGREIVPDLRIGIEFYPSLHHTAAGTPH
jgi:diguanylate cyclase (GGDEF)-like protein